ncbi:MAG: SUMF1/EgtB/PvdO family nonheme iron enzyme [Candidatus Hydrogenedentes bacterium]|nr:SUMF1/EgtB/PvdO family nonheme iron enzyme [Candidatus Hydrogenedentota bacterium]
MNRGRLICCLLCLALACAGAAAQRGSGGTAAGPAPQKWAVLVGVGDYEDSAFGDLPNAVRDAASVRDVLTGAPEGFPADNVVLLCDGAPDPMHRPTRNNILAVLGQWVQLAGPEDSLLVYFAGHGVDVEGRLYLVPGDARQGDLENTALPFALFEQKLDGSAAKRSLVILDACHSGAGRNTPTMTRGMMSDIERFSEGRITIASCQVNELSHEYEDQGHGAFTWFLLQGFRGEADSDGDGRISALEISRYTFEQTRRWAARTGKSQNPRLLSDISGDIILARPYATGPGTQAPRPPVVVTPPPPPPPPKEPEAGEVRVFEGGEFAWIPPGTFEMGSKLSPERVIATYGGDAEWKEFHEDEHPRHTVTLTRGFWLATKEVTVGEFRAFADAAGYQTDAEKGGSGYTYSLDTGQWGDTKGASWRNPGWALEDRQPVVLVSWNDAVAYCEWLSRKTGETYRLPTEAQWEYACRAGTDTEFWWGDRAEDGRGRLNGADETQLPNGKQWTYRFPFSDGYWNVSPVGSFKANRWGLSDMHGNVWEWCSDWFGDYASGSVTDPSGPASGERRVVRGGSWVNSPRGCRSAYRYYDPPGYRYTLIGLRLLRTP